MSEGECRSAACGRECREYPEVTVWVDADACPGPIKEILFRAAVRVEIQTVFVANHALRTPKSRFIRCVQVAAGFDVADTRIVDSVAAGDLVVTADVPLAARVVAAGGVALNPRGTLYTSNNIGDHLAQRNLMDELRSAGMVSGGPAAPGRAELQAFAAELDKFLTVHARDRGASGS
jgi:uncharacterized protein